MVGLTIFLLVVIVAFDFPFINFNIKLHIGLHACIEDQWGRLACE
jgi:hypothetical protein